MVVGDHNRLSTWITALSRNSDDRRLLQGKFRCERRRQMLPDKAVHFSLSIRCKVLKAEADLQGWIGFLVTKFAGGCGILG